MGPMFHYRTSLEQTIAEILIRRRVKWSVEVGLSWELPLGQFLFSQNLEVNAAERDRH